MKTVKLLSMSLLMSILVISCKKENKEPEVLETPVEIEYSGGNFEQAQVDPTTAPVLVLENNVVDLGDVKAGESVEKVVKFRNEGKGPLIIKDAKASCGCTVPEYSKEPVPVNEEGELTVKYSAPAYNGHVSKTVTLFTNTVNGDEVFKVNANIVGGEEPATQDATSSQPAPNL
ncbi:DUF1573 domain-containing protein [Weeksellaceae bacterium TAE3-ERU29]|nr:DUF1573 domain-containing protein [Weeksellaceae bacterium TAE3-ERU29]